MVPTNRKSILLLTSLLLISSQIITLQENKMVVRLAAILFLMVLTVSIILSFLKNIQTSFTFTDHYWIVFR